MLVHEVTEAFQDLSRQCLAVENDFFDWFLFPDPMLSYQIIARLRILGRDDLADTIERVQHHEKDLLQHVCLN